MTEQLILQKFFNQSGFPYMDIGSQKYILPSLMQFNELGLAITRGEFDLVIAKIAKALDEGQQTMTNNPKSKIAQYDYPLESINLISNLENVDNLALMRLSFIINRDDNLPVLIEINSQTPSLNYELESGALLLEELTTNTKAKTIQNLKDCLIDNLNQLAQSLNKPLSECNIGLLTCDDPEDIYQMSYYKKLIQELGLGKEVEVLTNLNFNFTRDGYCVNSITNTKYDILFNWYPLEWGVQESFGSGESFARLLENCINQGKVAIFNGIESFVIQNKNYLVFMQEQNLWPLEIQNYISDSYYTESELLLSQGSNCNWIAKPVWGRHGSGVFGSIDFRKFWGDFSDEYYNDQNCVYQPLWISKEFNHQKATLEVFVYKTNSGWVAGGVGLRLSNDTITSASASCHMVI